MKVTCKSCAVSFKVKGEVAPGKAFKFKCPKCGELNRLTYEDVQAAEAPKVDCSECGSQMPLPPPGEDSICDQCKATRAVKEAQARMAQADAGPMPEGVEFNDDIFADDTMPSEIEERDEAPKPPPKVEAKVETKVEAKEEPKDEPEEEAAPALADDKLEIKEPEAPKPVEEKKPEPVKTPTPPPAVAKKAEAPSAIDDDDEDEEIVIGKPKQKPGTPDSAYKVRSPDGLVIGPVKLGTLRDLIVARKVHTDEEFQRDDGPWMNMADFPELFEIFQLQSVAKSKKETVDVVAEDSSHTQMSKEKILSMLKVKKACVGCGEEIFVIEDIPNPLCDQCRIEAMMAKRKAQAAPPVEASYKIRSSDGLMLGPLKKATIEDLVTAGNIRGVEEVSVNDGPWKSILDIKEFAGLFDPSVEDVIDLTESADA